MRHLPRRRFGQGVIHPRLVQRDDRPRAHTWRNRGQGRLLGWGKSHLLIWVVLPTFSYTGIYQISGLKTSWPSINTGRGLAALHQLVVGAAHAQIWQVLSRFMVSTRWGMQKLSIGLTPLKTNMDTQNSHIWKEIHFENHHSWYLC